VKLICRAFLQEFDKLAIAMKTKEPIVTYPPQVNKNRIPSFSSITIFDSVPSQEAFGNVRVSPNDTYKRGETIVVEFWAGSPKNNMVSNNHLIILIIIDEWKVLSDC
jgi:hypothetical protein